MVTQTLLVKSTYKLWPFALSSFTTRATSRTWHQYLSLYAFVFSERGPCHWSPQGAERTMGSSLSVGLSDETHWAVGSFVSRWRSLASKHWFHVWKQLSGSSRGLLSEQSPKPFKMEKRQPMSYISSFLKPYDFVFMYEFCFSRLKF